MLVLLMSLCVSAQCDSLESELYKIELNMKQIRSCLCIRKPEYDDFRSVASQTLKLAKKCQELSPRVDTISAQVKQLRKELK